MSIYIVRPKTTVLGRFPNLATRKLSATSRQEQVKEVAALWEENSTYEEIREWVQDTPEAHKINLLPNPDSPEITGTTLVEMSEETAAQMGRELPNADILSNQPIELIQPQRQQDTHKHELTSAELWHLEAIELHVQRQNGFKWTGKNVTIAVFDTGIDSTHIELNSKVVEAYRFQVGQPQPQPIAGSGDTDGHGTHVAGLIGGKTVGVAPEAKLINGVVIPGGVGTEANFLAALKWLSTRLDVQIVNISAGFPEYSEIMSDVVETMLAVGILPICAVGNDGRDRTRSPGNCRGVISVGATNQKKRVAGFSSSGILIEDRHQYRVPSLVAPGEGVYSCVMGGGYEAWEGTSMATPIVSGVAATILEEYPDITIGDIREELLSRCRDLGQPIERQGAGIIQIHT